MWRLGGRCCSCPRAPTGYVGKNPRAVGFALLTSHTTPFHEQACLRQLLCCGNKDPQSPGRKSRQVDT